jgi:hypothetical protein
VERNWTRKEKRWARTAFELGIHFNLIAKKLKCSMRALSMMLFKNPWGPTASHIVSLWSKERQMLFRAFHQGLLNELSGVPKYIRAARKVREEEKAKAMFLQGGIQ